VDFVRSIISIGSTLLDIPDIGGMCVLDYALKYNYQDILIEVIKGGARLGILNEKGVEIMHLASATDNLDLLKALLQRNVLPSQISK
jgi:ankyrin repeat protein